MMETNELFKTWDEGNKKLFSGEKISKTMIEQYLKPRIIKTSALFTFNLVVYCLVQVASIILLSVNIIGYKSNPTMLSAIIPMLILSIGFLIFGYFSFLKLRDIRNYNENLMHLLSEKLRFIRTYYETWMVIISFSTLIMIFGLTTMVDNQDGFYRINNPRLYLIISLAVLVFIYGTQKLSGILSTRALKTYLSDLQQSFLDGSQQMEQQRRKFHWLVVVLVILFLAIFILGLIKSKGVL